MHQQFNTPIKYPVHVFFSMPISNRVFISLNTTPGYFKRYLMVVINVTSAKYDLL